jgi:hypothetical protein
MDKRALKLVRGAGVFIARLILVEICGRGKLKPGVEPGVEATGHGHVPETHKTLGIMNSLAAGAAACERKSARFCWFQC